jgi:hypothetical protein
MYGKVQFTGPLSVRTFTVSSVRPKKHTSENTANLYYPEEDSRQKFGTSELAHVLDDLP